VINSNGTGLTQLTTNNASDGSPSISGDGSKIAFVSMSKGGDDFEIFVINSDGTGLIQLTTNTASDWSPSISGNGSKIAFSSDVDGDGEIFVINSDGTGLTQLTTNTASDRSPSISGDGSKIAFTSGMIFVINSDGTDLTQLTSHTNSAYPSISADGSKIAFYSYVDSGYEVFVINSDGTGLTQLTFNTSEFSVEPSISISGDGSKIAFESRVDGDYEIFVASYTPSIPTTPSVFNTGQPENPYPCIRGIHKGEITPNKAIIVHKMYTYPCVGTGGHTEYVRFHGNGLNVTKTWNGYIDDYHNIFFNPPITLQVNTPYNYEIRTGSYPQIIHEQSLLTPNGTINCTLFTDANGKTYND
jgi:tricorn protease-like protein